MTGAEERERQIAKVEKHLSGLSPAQLLTIKQYLTGQELAFHKEMAKNSLWYFLTEVLGYRDLYEPFHRPLCEDLQVYKRFRLRMTAREHFKSTIYTIGYPLWRMVKDPNITIMLAHEVARMSIKYLNEIRGHMRSETFKELFPEYTLSSDTKGEIRLANRRGDPKDPTIGITGVGQTSTSAHPKLFVFDDVETRDNTNTVDGLEGLWNFYMESISQLAKTPDAEILIVGTPWSELGLYMRLIKNFAATVNGVPTGKVSGLYDVLRYSMLTDENDDLSAVFPTRFTPERIRELRMQFTPHEFACQYLVNPRSDANALIKSEWLQDYDTHPRRLNIFVTVDPASSTDLRADYTAIVVVGVDDEGKWYVLETVREHLDPGDLIKRIFGIHQKYNPVRIGIEEENFQKMIKYALKESMKKTGHYFTVTPLKSERAKDAKTKRILGLAPMLENGTIFFKPEQIELKKELLDAGQVGVSDHDDLADALGYMPQLVFPKDKEYHHNKTAMETRMELAHRNMKDMERWTGQKQSIREFI